MEGDDIRLRLLFGRFLEKNGLVTGAQIRVAMKLKNELSPSLAETALQEGVLTVERLNDVRQFQRDEAVLFDQAMMKMGILDEEGLQALKEQAAKRSVPIGKVLVMQGALTEDQLEEQIEAYHDYNAELNAGRPVTKGARP